MRSQPETKGAFASSAPEDTVIPQREGPGLVSQKEDTVQNELQNEATVLGTIHILCCLVISSFGAILISPAYSSRLKPAVSTLLMSGYPFAGALCFAVTGFLSIISGKKSTKPFATSSVTSSAVSSVVAGVGLLFLIDSLVALGAASQLCDSEKEHLFLPHSGSPNPTYEVKDCVLDGISLTAVLAVMLVFSALELLLAAYASVFWWRRVHSSHPGSSFSLPQSQDHIKRVKDFFKAMDMCNC